MNRKYGQNVTSEFTKVLSFDKDKVHRDETQETTTKLPCLTAKGAFIRVKRNIIVIFMLPLS